MRAVFSVNLPADEAGVYPPNTEIIRLLRSFGCEPVEVDVLNNETEKLQKYRELAEVLFMDVPQTATARIEHCIYYGYFADDYTRFVVLKRVQGQITFRLANTMLTSLQRSTVKLIQKLLAAKINDRPLEISNQDVVIYERGNDFILFNGRVVPNPLLETIRSDRKSLLLTVVPLAIFIFIASSILLGLSEENFGFLGGTLEQLSTALITTALVSVLSLLETYIEIYRNKTVVW